MLKKYKDKLVLCNGIHIAVYVYCCYVVKV